jgi:hypothetical protein
MWKRSLTKEREKCMEIYPFISKLKVPSFRGNKEIGGKWGKFSLQGKNLTFFFFFEEVYFKKLFGYFAIEL